MKTFNKMQQEKTSIGWIIENLLESIEREDMLSLEYRTYRLLKKYFEEFIFGSYKQAGNVEPLNINDLYTYAGKELDDIIDTALIGETTFKLGKGEENGVEEDVEAILASSDPLATWAEQANEDWEKTERDIMARLDKDKERDERWKKVIDEAEADGSLDNFENFMVTFYTVDRELKNEDKNIRSKESGDDNDNEDVTTAYMSLFHKVRSKYLLHLFGQLYPIGRVFGLFGPDDASGGDLTGAYEKWHKSYFHLERADFDNVSSIEESEYLANSVFETVDKMVAILTKTGDKPLPELVISASDRERFQDFTSQSIYSWFLFHRIASVICAIQSWLQVWRKFKEKLLTVRKDQIEYVGSEGFINFSKLGLIEDSFAPLINANGMLRFSVNGSRLNAEVTAAGYMQASGFLKGLSSLDTELLEQCSYEKCERWFVKSYIGEKKKREYCSKKCSSTARQEKKETISKAPMSIKPSSKKR